MEKSDYVYIMCPVPVEMLKGLPLPFLLNETPTTPIKEEETFVPLWYGNACFPEDDIS